LKRKRYGQNKEKKKKKKKKKPNALHKRREALREAFSFLSMPCTLR
jgi:hypothetical protein